MMVSQYVPLEKIAEVYLVKKSWLYEETRHNRLPGMVRIGRLIRVDLAVFDAAIKAGILALRDTSREHEVFVDHDSAQD